MVHDLDESCVGDLVALEAQAAGLAGLATWWPHRAAADMQAFGLPVFSLGATPTGPQRLKYVPKMRWSPPPWGDFTVGREDLCGATTIFGVLFVPSTALRTSSRLRRCDPATPSDAKPNESVRVSPLRSHGAV